MVGVVMHVINQFVPRACAVAAAGVALSAGALTAASAAGGGVPAHPGALSPPGSVAGRGGPLRPASNDHAAGRAAAPFNDPKFAGYETQVATGSATVASASFTVPALSCTAAAQAITPEAGVRESTATGNYSDAFVFTGCVNGRAVYFPSLVDNGTETDYTTTHFAAGDVIDLTTKVSTNRTRVQVTDVTTGVTQKIIGPAATAHAAFIGDDGWFTSTGALLGVPNFGKLTFQNCLIDGNALGSLHPAGYQRVVPGGPVQITLGIFQPGGTAFNTHYKHS
jgi:hypothetical protein